MFLLVHQEVMADFIECLGEVHNDNISLLTIIQVLNHVVDELYMLSFTRTKFAKAMLEGV
jgi:cytochrome b